MIVGIHRTSGFDLCPSQLKMEVCIDTDLLEPHLSASPSAPAALSRM